MGSRRFSELRKDAVKARYQKILEGSDAYARFQRILRQTEKDENFLKAFEMAEDRASGRPQQGIEVNSVDDSDRPTTDALLETITTLRTELDNLRKGVELETKE